ncbi:MAG: DUF4258 domain-containing protein [Rhodospirillaceae bacterium]|nr:DUF4258 domain-containing protein [Rhodospirillaceae bacterium]
MLSRTDAEALIHRLARKPGAVVLELPHAQSRMLARRISTADVFKVMREGRVDRGPVRDEWGDARYRVSGAAWERNVRVVVALHGEDKVFVVTVY